MSSIISTSIIWVEMDEIRISLFCRRSGIAPGTVHRNVKHLQFGMMAATLRGRSTARWVLPSPELPYIYSGLKGVWPGSTATAIPARTCQAVALSFDEGRERVVRMSRGSMTIFLRPGMTNGFFIFAVLVWVLNCEMAVVSASTLARSVRRFWERRSADGSPVRRVGR